MMDTLYSKPGLQSISLILAFCSVAVCFYLLTFTTGTFRNTVYHPMATYRSNDEMYPEQVDILSVESPATFQSNKTILIYTTLFGDAQWSNLRVNQKHSYLKEIGCPQTNCAISYDKGDISFSDAVIFHARDMPSVSSLRNISRPRQQRWVYFISENPGNTPDPTPFNGIFNWTMTYRTDSDIFLPYARFKATESVHDAALPSKNYATGKTKLAAWVVSHCGLLRETYVKKLENYIKIEVAGGCSKNYKYNFNCPRETCGDILQKEFKFYLSFENGFCQDYITEKYWGWPIENDIIPIVMGGGPYKFGKVAIPGSFINVEDFATVKDLADYLIYLDKNDTAYNEYFQWKQHYHLTTPSIGWPYVPVWTCEICQMLHNISYGHKVYDKLSEFWGVKENCMDRGKAVQQIINKST